MEGLTEAVTEAEMSQMPFGFWVLGNLPFAGGRDLSHGPVSNAFRLLGSGEPPIGLLQSIARALVSNAFRLLGSGEQNATKVVTNRRL